MIKKIIDGLGPNGISSRIFFLSKISSKIHTGYVYHYSFSMILGLAMLTLILVYNLNWLCYNSTNNTDTNNVVNGNGMMMGSPSTTLSQQVNVDEPSNYGFEILYCWVVVLAEILKLS